MKSNSLNTETREALEALAKSDKIRGIKSRFVEDSERVDNFSHDLDGLFFDFSKTHISNDLLDVYCQFAEQVALTEKRHRLFSGERINITENRSVLHPLLRDPDNQGIATQSDEMIEQAHDAKRQLTDQCKHIESLLANRATPVTDIIHIGIGGSALGTKLLFEAISGQSSEIKIHFIGNIDAHELVSVFNQCNPQSTIVVGVSKTYTTAETLQNIRSICSWYQDNNIDDYMQHVFAVTANYDNAIGFGIKPENIVTFPQWVGGRYSVWSSVSISAILVIGLDKFEQFLSGAAMIDRHFYQTELSQNVCFLAAMLDHYYSNFMQAESRAIFAYDARLNSLVDYLQQLETESNGKDRQLDGQPVDQKTSPVVWGGVGTDVQHSVFQMLHQGTSLIATEFIIVKNADHNLEDHHTELLANAVAQSAALLEGQDFDTVKQLHSTEDLSDATLKAKIFSGERPSSTLVMDSLSPYLLGALLALYEHRTFCVGVFNNINSYDQMGVELGKRLAKDIKSVMVGAEEAHDAMDASTKQLIKLLRC